MKYFLKGWSFIFTLLFGILFVWGIGNSGLVVYFREKYDHPEGYYVEDDVLSYPLNLISGTIYAEDEWAAIHEVGHLIDDKYDHPSQSTSFALSIIKFIDLCYHGQDQWYLSLYENSCHWLLYEDDDDGTAELYAEIYQRYMKGWNFPSYITVFFSPDWEEIVDENP
jgi:hypothetical protein